MADVVQRVNEIRRAIDAVATGPVDIMAVTKRHTPDEINPLAESEIIRIGENRVQEFMDKRDKLNSRFEPHIIGQLQRNKVKYIIQCVTMIESVDRIELAQEIDRQAQMHGVVMPVLIQVNLAREEQKGGVYIEDYPALLDLSRTDVCDYIIEAVSSVLRSAPISYVKWDMNRNMTEIGSALLDSEHQGEVEHRYMLGLYRVLETITQSFPDVLFESCSGGGGRFDAGLLYYMPQTWTSDDTDAIERLKIQYSTSMVYPISAIGSHVSAVPNHQTGRTTPMQTRCDVAMSGNFGFELDLSKLSEDDMATAKKAVELCKRIRGTVQQGEFTRLLSPYEGSMTAWQFVRGDAVILCYFKVLNVPAEPLRRIKMKGLDPDAHYRAEDGTVYSGGALMTMGYPADWRMRDFESRVILLEKV